MARIVKTGGSGSSPHIDRLMRLSASNFSAMAVRKLERESISKTLPTMSRVGAPISFSGVVSGALNMASAAPNVADKNLHTGAQLLGGVRELMAGGRAAGASRKLNADLVGRMSSHFNSTSSPGASGLLSAEAGRLLNPIIRKEN